TGYRVNVDSVLLAHFAAQGKPARLAVDLGAGVGVLSLLLDELGGATGFALVEREAELLDHAAHNFAARGKQPRLFRADLGVSGLPGELAQSADLVVSNPPFFVAEQGRVPRDSGRRRARQGALEPFLG